MSRNSTDDILNMTAALLPAVANPVEFPSNLTRTSTNLILWDILLRLGGGAIIGGSGIYEFDKYTIFYYPPQSVDNAILPVKSAIKQAYIFSNTNCEITIGTMETGADTILQQTQIEANKRTPLGLQYCTDNAIQTITVNFLTGNPTEFYILFIHVPLPF